MYDVTADNDKCVGFRECVDICPVEVYEMQDEIVNEISRQDVAGLTVLT